MILTRALPCAEKEEGEYFWRPASASSKTRSGVSVPKADNPKHQTGEMPGSSGQEQDERRVSGAAAEATPTAAPGKSGPLPPPEPFLSLRPLARSFGKQVAKYLVVSPTRGAT